MNKLVSGYLWAWTNWKAGSKSVSTLKRYYPDSDIFINVDFDGDGVHDWIEIVTIFKTYGWEWGGDWKSFKDAPHFQMDFGFDWKVLKQRVDRGITIVDNGIIYPKI
jgi:hypothetical protein